MKTLNLPYVSIIVVNYNGRHHLEKCLRSLEENSYPCSKYEIIVVDNNSTDGSLQLLEKDFPTLHVVKLDKNYGWAGGVNIGVKYAKGEYLTILNNDVVVDENWLTELVKPALSNDNIEICTSKKLCMDNPTVLDGAGGAMNIIGQGWDRGMLRKDQGQYEEVVEVSHPSGASFLLKRRLINIFGYALYPDFFMYQDDLDIGWRTRLLGFKVIYVPKSVIFHKGAGSTRCSPFTYYHFYRNMLVVFCKNLERGNLAKLLALLIINAVVTQLFAFVSYKEVGYLVNIPKILVYLITSMKRIAEKRKLVQRLRKINDQQIFSLFSPTIISPKETGKFAIAYQKLVNLYLKTVIIKGAGQIQGVFIYQ
ncbi:MAG: glycosyltransferase family 2 protein [Candidatus Bathyarchaeota archaeon]|nr:glycosyltransferase family 2 protein [Candidatus Bathyarchaeota archaeon]